MPTYEFRCESGHATEKFFRSMSAAPAVIECPECGAAAVRQVSGGIGLVFKGSGFYITDYGKDGKKPRAPEKSESASSDAGGKSEGGGDSASKPAAADKPQNKATGSSGTDK
jgi:putative FmdB family regulatory protein